MLLAGAAALVWTASSWCSARGARHLGGVSGNLVRLGVGLLLVAIVATLAGGAWWRWDRPGAGWLLLSGVIGMGLCDILLLTAFARLGARVPSLLVNSIGVPVAAGMAWLWLGEALAPVHLVLMAAILAGVLAAIWPRPGEARIDLIGMLAAAASGVLFGAATVLSRVAYAEAAAAQAPMPWLDATALRLAGGLAVTLAIWPCCAGALRVWRDGPGRWREGAPWLTLNGVLGPGVGLALFQWALLTTPAGIAQAVVAVIPVLVLALTWATGEDRPGRRAVLGTVLAVGSVAALALASSLLPPAPAR